MDAKLLKAEEEAKELHYLHADGQAKTQKQLEKLQSTMKKYMQTKKAHILSLEEQLRAKEEERKRVFEEKKSSNSHEQKLEKEIEKLRAELSASKNLLNETIQISRTKHEELTENLQRAQAELEVARRGVFVENEGIFSPSQVEGFLKEISATRRELDETKDQEMKARKEKNDLAKVFINLKKKYESLLKETDDSRRKEEEMQSALQQQIRDLLVKKEDLERSLSLSEDSLKTAKTKEKELLEREREMEVSLSQLKALLSKINLRFQEEKEKVRVMQLEHSQTLTKLAEAQTQNEELLKSKMSQKDLEEEIGSLRSRLSTCEGHLKKEKEEKDDTHREFEEYKLKAHAALQNHTEEMTKIESYLETIQNLERDVLSFKQNELRLNAKILELESAHASSFSLKQQVRDLQTENAELLSQVQAFHFRISK